MPEIIEFPAMLSLEMLGAYDDRAYTQRYPFPLDLFFPDHGDFIAFVGNVDSRALVRASVGAFRAGTLFPSEGAALPAGTTAADWSDHRSFWAQGSRARRSPSSAAGAWREERCLPGSRLFSSPRSPAASFGRAGRSIAGSSSLRATA